MGDLRAAHHERVLGDIEAADQILAHFLGSKHPIRLGLEEYKRQYVEKFREMGIYNKVREVNNVG
jgi:hypothetical protein